MFAAVCHTDPPPVADGYSPILRGLCSSQMFTQYAAKMASRPDDGVIDDLTGGIGACVCAPLDEAAVFV